MIYLSEQSENQLKFENLLRQAKNIVLDKLSREPSLESLDGNKFELIVFKACEQAAKKTSFEGKLIHTDDRDFPDIIAAKLFGIEVKMTKKDSWTSIGNSVLESSRVSGLEKIYVFFGKLGGGINVIYRNYPECLKGIAVTHYPRYQIDMELQENESIFSKMGITYDELRETKNPIKPIRAYYKSKLRNGQELWWVDDDIDESTAPSPIIRQFSNLDREEKDSIMARIMIFFPEIFSSKNARKYQRAAAYLASSHGIVSSNLRDEFSAGGVTKLSYRGKEYKLPHVVGEMIRISKLISEILDDQDKHLLSEHWRKEIKGHHSPKQAWYEEINEQSGYIDGELKLSDLFEGDSRGSINISE